MPSTKAAKEPYRDIVRDPREDEDWFLGLPPGAQANVRESWCADRVRYIARFERIDQWRNRCLREGLFTVTGPILFMFSGGPILVSVPAGLLTGWIWFRANTGRLTSGAISMAAVVFANVIGGVWTSRGDVPGFLFTTFLAFIAGLLGATYGLRRELDERERV